MDVVLTVLVATPPSWVTVIVEFAYLVDVTSDTGPLTVIVITLVLALDEAHVGPSAVVDAANEPTSEVVIKAVESSVI